MYLKTLFLTGIIILATGHVFASETNGTIESGTASARICKDVLCATYGQINFKPTGSTAVTITDAGLSGYAWGDEIGWINFSPTGSGVTLDVNTGVLSGYAYANSGSWINVNPTDVGGGTNVGVTINSSGQFVGWAWVSGAQGGWMKFDCAASSTCVKTDWRPVGSRQSTAASQSSKMVRNTPTLSPVPMNQNNPLLPTSVDTADERVQYEDSDVGQPVRTTPSEGISYTESRIADFYSALGIARSVVSTGGDYVQSYNAPLSIEPHQKGVLIWDFSTDDMRAHDSRQGVIVEVPEYAAFVPIHLFADMVPETIIEDEGVIVDNGALSIVGGTIFTVTAFDTEGNQMHTFNKPLKITLVVPEQLRGQKNIGVYYLDETNKKWVAIDTLLLRDHYITFEVDHLTRFAIFSIPDSVTGAYDMSRISDLFTLGFLSWHWPVLGVLATFLLWGRRIKKERKNVSNEV